MTRFFVSDTHFNHANIIQYCLRPFMSVQHMNDAMVKWWNQRVTQSDEVWHLGDVGFGKSALDWVALLNGHKRLVRGNHDAGFTKSQLMQCFEEVHDRPVELTLTDPELGAEPVWLCHYPLQRHDTLYTLCGHVHNLWKVQRRMLNMSVDQWYFKPVSEREVLECIWSEKEGYWDGNVYPDAPIEWKMAVSTKQPRPEGEPTLDILKMELKKKEGTCGG